VDEELASMPSSKFNLPDKRMAARAFQRASAQKAACFASAISRSSSMKSSAELSLSRWLPIVGKLQFRGEESPARLLSDDADRSENKEWLLLFSAATGDASTHSSTSCGKDLRCGGSSPKARAAVAKGLSMSLVTVPPIRGCGEC